MEPIESVWGLCPECRCGGWWLPEDLEAGVPCTACWLAELNRREQDNV